jgi:hypothetical protein
MKPENHEPTKKNRPSPLLIGAGIGIVLGVVIWRCNG